MPAKSNPFKKEEDVQKNPDQHIDQDFPGFPHHPSSEKSITPQTETDKKLAGIKKKKTKKTSGG